MSSAIDRMNTCQNCGNQNTPETNFCRFCGTKTGEFRPAMQQDPYNYSAPRPYAWKTDEFQTKAEARKQEAYGNATAQPAYSLMNNQVGSPVSFRCPNCMSNYPPRLERRVSTAGWITFAVLLVFFFPLFWIGLLMKEDVRICQSCNTKVA